MGSYWVIQADKAPRSRLFHSPSPMRDRTGKPADQSRILSAGELMRRLFVIAVLCFGLLLRAQSIHGREGIILPAARG